ncbi:type II toxin-antitoxin system RelB/DinJ family antitoxin [Syntrophomonas wolfei]|nr:type II toxin-antitoxin system RelB/DinJ family antitoxin [Syntrophomonas wolfei]
MAKTTNISIRMDKDLKERADAVFNEMGMNMTTAFNIFVRQTLRQGKIPFEIYADPFYGERNMKALHQSIQEAEEGKFVTKTLDELLAMEK